MHFLLLKYLLCNARPGSRSIVPSKMSCRNQDRSGGDSEEQMIWDLAETRAWALEIPILLPNHPRLF